jgi:hypothetical protein
VSEPTKRKQVTFTNDYSCCTEVIISKLLDLDIINLRQNEKGPRIHFNYHSGSLLIFCAHGIKNIRVMLTSYVKFTEKC